MSIFGPSRDERLAAAADALRPYGFTLDRSRARELRRYEPLRDMAAPEAYVVAVHGAIEGVPVEAYEYEYSSSDSDGNTTTHDALVVILRHAWINGGASFYPDARAWSTAASFIDALFWIPPLTFLKAFQLFNESRNPDRVVGEPDFDRAYVVHADSDEAARRAISPSLRGAVTKIAFRGAVELRTGMLLYSPREYRLDARNAVSAFGVGAALLGALAPTSGHPMR